jgi:formylglycine-generating enzyme required for sulfatase activity
VLIPTGKHPTPDGATESIKGFKISAHEVTIGQYQEFLDALADLAKSGKPTPYDPADQPADKAGHTPDDWNAMLSAAKSGGTWRGHPLAMEAPVVGIDWWDASAYAKWKNARLPTQEEWFAAMRSGVEEPAKLAPGPWQAVTVSTPDETTNGLLGMAGAVAEWTNRPSVPPDNPLGQKKWIIAGGSYLKPANGALTREWTDNRSLRRPDLGFRVVFDP